MRAIDKKNYIKRVNLLVEERYLNERSEEPMIDVSCAALGNIQINGRYLLFKEKTKFQPIGGSLKFLDSALPFLEQIGFQTDRTDKDIRIRIPSSKWDIFKKWFESGKDREVSISREIDEELGPYLGREFTNKMITDKYELKEVITDKYRIFQIHRISFDEVVMKAIMNLVESNPSFILATPDEIKSQANGISDHSKYIL